MPDFKQRSAQMEMMDDLNCSGDLVAQTLHELEVINKWLGGNAVTMNGVKKIFKNLNSKDEIVLADLGCGSGEMLRLIDDWAQRNQYKVRLIGFDANPNIIDYARQHTVANPRITFEAMDIFSEEFKSKKFDVVIGTLFYHHFTSSQLIDFFTTLRKQTKVGILINDIHRHPLAYYSIKYLTKWFSQSAMVKMDAPISVMRAFHKDELVNILQSASFAHYSIIWKWAFRWQVIAKS
jgi:2-polyprenyl-3-methyl-5-hydroxy-6-metoxy-1,4-benzoquinol methylase